MSPLDLAVAGSAFTLWIVVVSRTGNVMRPGPERSLWFVLAMFALSLTVRVDPIRQVLAHALGDFSVPLVYLCCAVLAAAGARRLVDSVADPMTRYARPPLLLTAVALAVVVASYVFGPAPAALPVDASSAVLERAPYYAGGLESVARWSVWLAYLTWALVGNAQLTGRFAKHAARATPGRLTIGLSLGELGCRVGFAYVALKAVMVAAWFLGVGPQLLPLDVLADLAALVSMALITIAATYDALRARARTIRMTASRVRSLWRLRNLWRVLKKAAPDDAGSLEGPTVRSLLFCVALGIRDRQLALRPYVGADAPRSALEAAHAAGYRGAEARAQAEAAVLEAGRRAKLHGATPVADVAYDATYEIVGGRDLDEEVCWLERVAGAHRRSPFVSSFAAILQQRSDLAEKPAPRDLDRTATRQFAFSKGEQG